MAFVEVNGNEVILVVQSLDCDALLHEVFVQPPRNSEQFNMEIPYFYMCKEL